MLANKSNPKVLGLPKHGSGFLKQGVWGAEEIIIKRELYFCL